MTCPSKNTLRRDIWWAPAYDKRPKGPGEPDYGIHGLEITFVVRSEDLQSGLTFTVMTNWQLPHVRAEQGRNQPASIYMPIAGPVAIHRLALHDAVYNAQECQVVNGPCNGDGSFSLGQAFFDLLVTEGVESLWLKMEQQLKDWS